MNDETKRLIEDAARLLGIEIEYRLDIEKYWTGGFYSGKPFNPLDPERGDLMKVATAAILCINWENETVTCPVVLYDYCQNFTKGDHGSLALAVLRAASAVLKAREA